MQLDCRDTDDAAFHALRQCIATSTDPDDVESARIALERLSRSGHVPSLVWAATDTWNRVGDRSRAIEYARRAIDQQPDPLICRMLGDWLWELASDATLFRSTSSATILSQSNHCSNTCNEMAESLADTLCIDLHEACIASDSSTSHHCRAIQTLVRACRNAGLAAWRVGAETFGDVSCIQRMASAHAQDDPDTAMAWWETAAAHGDPSSIVLLSHLAIAQVSGDDTEVQRSNKHGPSTESNALEGEQKDDRDESLMAFVHRAAAQGDALSLRALGDIACGLITPNQQRTKQPKARKTRKQLGKSEPLQDSRTSQARASDNDPNHQSSESNTVDCWNYADQSHDAALEFYRSAIRAGDKHSMLRAAQLLWTGTKHAAPDIQSAIQLFIESSREMSLPTLTQMGQLLHKGDDSVGLVPDVQRASQLLAESIEREESTESMRILADLIWQGDGCSKDPERAWELYERSGKRGDVMGKLGMVRCLWTGIGTDRNVRRARRVFREVISSATMTAMHMQEEAEGNDCKRRLTDSEIDSAIESLVSVSQ